MARSAKPRLPPPAHRRRLPSPRAARRRGGLRQTSKPPERGRSTPSTLSAVSLVTLAPELTVMGALPASTCRSRAVAAALVKLLSNLQIHHLSHLGFFSDNSSVFPRPLGPPVTGYGILVISASSITSTRPSVARLRRRR